MKNDWGDLSENIRDSRAAVVRRIGGQPLGGSMWGRDPVAYWQPPNEL